MAVCVQNSGNKLRTSPWSLAHGIFKECGCPLVRSGMIALHPIQCLCSQGMMEMIFSKVAMRSVKVEIKRAIGRGDDVCEFVIKV
jgi:hypothetical protein